MLNGIDSLDKSRLKMQNSATMLLTERLNQCFDPVSARADKFADWYFAYRSVLHNITECEIGVGVKFWERPPSCSPLITVYCTLANYPNIFYSTSFKLIRHATTSLARHSINFTDRRTLSEAVALDLGKSINCGICSECHSQ